MKAGCRKTIIVFSLIIALAGCASKQPAEYAQQDQQDRQDPWEGYNRGVFAVNDSLDKVLLKPIALGYQKVTPDPLRTGVSNFYSNLGDVPTALNNLLQGKIVAASSDVMRVLINTTIGIVGLFDPASKMGLVKHEEDLGQTLAVWGVGAGPYFMVPVLGPSTVRDFPARLVSFLIDPLSYIGDSGTRNTLRAVDFVQRREKFFGQEEIARKLSPDFYSAIREYYLSRRELLINDGAVEVDYDDEEIE